VRDLDQIRSFLTSSGPIAIVDLPWIPIFLLICFLLHPWLGLASTFAGIALLAVTVLTERSSRAPSQIVAQDAGTRIALVEAARRNSDTIAAMGMEPVLAKR
jgi:ABC-type protease/lipase transport system fused ATPase/permease subunit